MDHEEMLRRFQTDPDTLSPQDREFIETADQHFWKSREQGMYSSGKPGDNAPIGLDDNYNPFPITKPVAEQEDGSD